MTWTFGVSKTPKVFDHLRGFQNLEGFSLTIDFYKNYSSRKGAKTQRSEDAKGLLFFAARLQ